MRPNDDMPSGRRLVRGTSEPTTRVGISHAISENPIGELSANQARVQACAVTDVQMVWTLSPDGMPQDIAPEWCAYTGQSREQASGPGALDAVHLDDREANLATIQRALAERQPYQTQCRIRRWDGVYQSFLLRGTPVWTADGQLRQWVGTLTNITAYEQALRDRAVLLQREADLSQASMRAAHQAQVAEERFRRLVDANVIGVLLGDEERITEANDAFLDLVGYTRADLDTGAIRWREMTPPEYAPLDDRAIVELLERGECTAYEKEYVRKDGSHVPILIGAALLEREPLQWICFVVDQAERKRLEREVAARASMLEAIIEAMTDGVVVYGPTGEVHLINAAFRRLLALDEAALRQPYAERGQVRALCHPATGELLPIEEWPGQRLLSGETLTGPHSVDVLIQVPGRSAVLINCAGAPIRSAQGQVEGAVMVVRDVAERRRLEQELAERADELEAANRRLDELLHVVAHELRTPLANLKANLQLADRRVQRLASSMLVEREVGAEEPEPKPQADEGAPAVPVAMSAHELLGRAERQANQLARLLEDLTDASRVRTGKLDLRLAPCDLADLVRITVAEQRRMTKRLIHRHVPTSPVSVMADAERIEQVLTNYLTNAAKYSPAEMPIEVTLTMEEGRARVAVRDQGPGLTHEEQQHIWQRFHQAQDVSAAGPGGASASAGLGLGLYISKSIIEGHGGTVGVASAVGVGSTFWFTLPLAMSSTDQKDG